MSKLMIKFITIVFINFLIFFVLIILFELTCGYWFDKYNFGPYMREFRLKSNPYTVELMEQDMIIFTYEIIMDSEEKK